MADEDGGIGGVVAPFEEEAPEFVGGGDGERGGLKGGGDRGDVSGGDDVGITDIGGTQSVIVTAAV